MSFESLNNKLKKIGAPLVPKEIWDARIKATVTNPKLMKSLKKGWEATKTLRKVTRIVTPIGAATVVAGILYDQYKKKKRQKSGTKHLGSKKQKKAYGGKVNTYRSPRRTTYND